MIRRRPVLLVAAPVLALVLALAGCVTDGDRTETGTGALLDALAAIDGVTQVVPEQDDDDLIAVAVRTTAPATDDLVRIGTEVAEVVARYDGPPASVWRDATGTVPAVRVALGTGDEPAERLAQVRELVELPGVTGVQLQGEGDSVSVAEADDLHAVAVTAADLGVPLTMVSSTAQRMSAVVPAGAFTPEVADLVAQVDAWDGVTSVLLTDQGETDGSLWLTVQVRGDDRVAQVSERLAAAGEPAGTRVQFVVQSSFRSQGGVVGEALPAADPAIAEQAAAGDRWPDDPSAPVCTADEIDVQVLGTDAALGTRYLLIRATSTADHPCALTGRPEITFVRASGTPVPDVETGTPSGSPAAVRQVLPVGESVLSELRWGAMSTANDPDVTVSLLVAAEPGTEPTAVLLDQQLDVLDGAAVEVDAWLRSVDGWSL
ncbi:MAG TPA: DUF4232 domain-containing protein [Cellulomonas sp.]